MTCDGNGDHGRAGLKRRQWLLRAGVVLTAGLAGCSGNGGDEQRQGGGGTDRPTATQGDEPTVETETPPEERTTPGPEPGEETTSGDDKPATEQGEEGGQPGALGDEWPTFQHDRGRSGYAPESAPPSGAVTEAWRHELGAFATPEGQPALADGRLYTAYNCSSRDDPEFCLLAVDPVTGDEVWHTPVTSAAESSYTLGSHTAPVYGDGTVYAQTAGGHVFAVDAATGESQWDRHFESVSDDLDGTLLYSDGIVYAHAGPTGNTYNDGEGGIRALDAASGEVLWTFTDLRSFGTLAIADGVLIAKGQSRATTYGLDPESGERRWETDRYTTSRVGCSDGTCYVYGGSAHAFGTGGSQQWARENVAFSPTAPDEHGPAVANGRAFFRTQNSGIVAVDASTGEECWRVGRQGAAPADITGSPVLAGDGETVYTTASRYALAIDAGSGEVSWQHELPSGGASDPVVGNGAVYLTCEGQQGPLLVALA